jgi:hypothetical protein
MQVPIEIVAVLITIVLTAILTMQGWMISRIFSLEKKMTAVMQVLIDKGVNLDKGDTDHLRLNL